MRFRKKHNAHLNTLISAEKLKSDVDFTIITKLHPNSIGILAKKNLIISSTA
jgi:hypothetical protein